MTKWKLCKFPYTRVKAGTKYRYMVDLEKFWEWAYKNQQILNFSRFEKYSLGCEPDWVESKRNQNKKINKNNSPWTKQEDMILLDKLKTGRYI